MIREVPSNSSLPNFDGRGLFGTTPSYNRMLCEGSPVANRGETVDYGMAKGSNEQLHQSLDGATGLQNDSLTSPAHAASPTTNTNIRSGHTTPYGIIHSGATTPCNNHRGAYGSNMFPTVLPSNSSYSLRGEASQHSAGFAVSGWMDSVRFSEGFIGSTEDKSNDSMTLLTPPLEREGSMTRYSNTNALNEALIHLSIAKAHSPKELGQKGGRCAHTTDKIRLGICCMPKKMNSSTMDAMLERFESFGNFVIVRFDETILADTPAKWPTVDVMIAFYSSGFPLEKAVTYAELHPHIFFITEPRNQRVLLDRRDVYNALRLNNVPHPKVLFCNRDGYKGLPHSTFEQFPDYLIIDGRRIDKPFVEKPVSAEDHKVQVYYKGGGMKQLFRKVGNKSSDFHPDVSEVRTDGSYIYEEFIETEGKRDIKCYTVGPGYVFAEARKAPTGDGIVLRREDGKEMREPISLRGAELMAARKVIKVFRQIVCGFDILRQADGKFYVCDVNGWSFVKNVPEYVDRATLIMRDIFVEEVRKRGLHREFRNKTMTRSLLGVVGVMRHADRTPKQKVKIVVNVEPLLLAVFEGERKVTDEIVFKSGHPKLDAIYEVVCALLSSTPTSNCSDDDNESNMHVKGTITPVVSANFGPLSMPGASGPSSPPASFQSPVTDTRLLLASTNSERVNIPEEPPSPFGNYPNQQQPKATPTHLLGNNFFQQATPMETIALPAASLSSGFVGSDPSGTFTGRPKDDPFHSIATVATSAVNFSVRTGDNVSKSVLTSLKLMRDVLARHHEGLKVQVKPRAWDEEGNCIEALLVCKWGGWLTEAGHKQAQMMGRHFLRRIFGVNELSRIQKSQYMAQTNNERRVIHTAVEFSSAMLGEPFDEKRCIVNENLLGKTLGAKQLMAVTADKIKRIFNATDPTEIQSYLSLPGMRNIVDSPVVPDNNRTPRGAMQAMRDLIDSLCQSFSQSAMVKLYRDESMALLRQRWTNLLNAFYQKKTDSFDTTKIPDIFDYVSYDVCYNQRAFSNQFDMYPLFTLAEAFSTFVSDGEFGLTPSEKRDSAMLFATPLLEKITDDLRAIAKRQGPTMRMYFTSESHVTGLKNLLYNSSEPFLRMEEPMELHFLSHFVFKLYRYPDAEPDRQYQIEVHFSLGMDKNMFGIVQEHHVDYASVTPMIRIHNNLDLEKLQQITSYYASEVNTNASTPSASPQEGDSTTIEGFLGDTGHFGSFVHSSISKVSPEKQNKEKKKMKKDSDEDDD